MVNHALSRIQEAQKLGFEKIYVPLRNYQMEKEHIIKLLDKSERPFIIIPVETVNEVVRFDY